MSVCKLVVVVVAVVAVCGCWASPRPPEPRRDIAIALAVEQLELANGMKIVVVPEPDATDVAVTVRYGVGSASDPAGREGMAHLVEHVLFEHVRDDQTGGAGEPLFDFLVANTLEVNGFTTADATLYATRVATESVGLVLAAEAARLELPCAAIPEPAFLRQREIVRNELREREQDSVVAAALHRAVFASGGTPATPGSVGAITQADACAFVDEHYRPSNAVVVISGATSAATVKSLVAGSLGKLAKRDGAARPSSRAAPDPRRAVTVETPIERTWLVLAWPLPADPAGRSRARAIVAMAAGMVDARTNGLVTVFELGTAAVRQIAIGVAPSPDITVADALASAKHAIDYLDPWFGTGFYEHAKTRALYDLAASLDRTLDRDTALAEAVAAGREAQAATAEAVRGLSTMSRDDARSILHASFDPDRATIVTLKPSPHRGVGGGGSLAPTIREEQRERREDPADARAPATAAPVIADGATLRTLRNGLRVVLMPRDATKTVEIRLVFPTGSADETASQRGMTTIAAAALTAPNETDAFRFMQVGGAIADAVERDHTVFAVRGLSAHLDLLLAGLGATIRQGDYSSEGLRDAANLQTLRLDDSLDEPAVRAWREALYGASHPYAKAGWREAARDVTAIDAVRRLREQRFTPDGATLIVAGSFDPAIAERWVEYHLGEWAGRAPARASSNAIFSPRVLARVEDSAQVAIQLAFEMPAGDPAANRVVAALVEAALADVRRQLGASYGMQAALVESRLSTTIQVGGRVDATRAKEVGTLLRERLDRLRQPSDETAALFVAARRSVLAELARTATTSALADRAVDEASLGRDPSASPPTERVRLSTIDRVVPFLRRIDLARAAIFARGSRVALEELFGALGREPTTIR